MNDQSPRLNRLLTIFFAILLSIQVGFLLVGFASNLVYYQRITTLNVMPEYLYGKVQISNEVVAQMAAERGLSLAQYAIYRIIINSLTGLIPIGLAALIIWRAGSQWFAWYTAFILVFLGANAFSEQLLVSQFISNEVFGSNAIFWFLLMPYFFLFPNGRAIPRRAAWLVGAIVVYHFFIQVGTVVAYVLPDIAARFKVPNWGESNFIWPVILNFFIVLACQVYRYRRVSSPIERKQTIWFLYGFGLMVALIPVVIFSDATGRFGDLQDFLWMPFTFGLAIAITRYRLWDVDVIIRRTLVYGVVSAGLALVFFGGVTVLQRVFQSVSGQQSAISVVISTLAIAALFNPLRRLTQDFIDRRFYRKKYNAEQALKKFTELARGVTDIEQLSAEMMAVVQETMQPEKVGLWLREAKK